MGASYVVGSLIPIVDGDEMSFDDEGSKFFDFEAYSLAMTTLNTVSGVFEPILGFAPTPALVGTHMTPTVGGWLPAVALEHPSAALAGQVHDVATNTAEYIVQTVYGRSKHLYQAVLPGLIMYATLVGYDVSGDPRYALGLTSKDGVVLLDVFHNLDYTRGIPASALTNPSGAPRAELDELGNAAVTLMYSSAHGGAGMAAPVFEPTTMTYRTPITAPLTKKPLVHIVIEGTTQYVSLVEVTTAYVRYAFYNAGSDVRAQNSSQFTIEALGTTYTEL